MSRWLLVAAICLSGTFIAGGASAAPVSESTVENACGDKIVAGCTSGICAMGCEKTEGGKLVAYGCTFPDKPGKTKATCTRTVMRPGQSSGGKSILSNMPSVLKAD